MRVLGRTLRWHEAQSASPEADADDANDQDITEFRSQAALANFVAADRMDIQYATKEACRSMARPTVASLRRTRRLARYLVRRPRLT